MADPKVVETALPYFQCTREMLTCFVRHNLSAKSMQLYMILEMHKDMSRGITHRLDISDLASQLDTTETTIYRSISRLKDVGLFIPDEWGTVKGTLPYAQLAKHTVQSAKNEKRKRLFYENLRERIVSWETASGEIADNSRIHAIFVVLAKEKKEHNQYYPKTTRNVVSDLENYAPSNGSPLFESVE